MSREKGKTQLKLVFTTAYTLKIEEKNEIAKAANT
jgi:hypothetical protein